MTAERTDTASSAVISDDGVYRYLLTREITQPFEPAGTVTFIMLNPSTADAEKDDPTIRRCKGFAARWGHSKLLVANLFAFRATKPGDLPSFFSEAEGPENQTYLRHAIIVATKVVAAWGAHQPCRLQYTDVFRMCGEFNKPLVCLGTNKDGSPKHPLYVRADAEVVPWP